MESTTTSWMLQGALFYQVSSMNMCIFVSLVSQPKPISSRRVGRRLTVVSRLISRCPTPFRRPRLWMPSQKSVNWQVPRVTSTTVFFGATNNNSDAFASLTFIRCQVSNSLWEVPAQAICSWINLAHCSRYSKRLPTWICHWWRIAKTPTSSIKTWLRWRNLMVTTRRFSFIRSSVPPKPVMSQQPLPWPCQDLWCTSACGACVYGTRTGVLRRIQ